MGYESDPTLVRDESPSTTDYLRDIHSELVEMRKLQERIAEALERIADKGTRDE